jgi:hypothetical protein
MPRARKLRQGLAENGVIIGGAGEEYARMSLNGVLVINEQALYMWIVRAATKYKNLVPVSVINRAFSATGSWGRDPSVEGSLRTLHDLGLLNIKYDKDDPSEEIWGVWPRVAPHKAIKVIPPYATRAEVLAGLEHLDED